MNHSAFGILFIFPLCYRMKVSEQRQFLLLLTLITSMILSSSAQALTLEDLINSKQLTLETKIQKQTQQIVGQPLVFTIEVATNRWFAKGTQLETLALTDAVILANSEVIINGSKTINGQTWSNQIREITLYPTRSGEYTLPSMDVYIAINTENNGVVAGVIATTEQSFTISLPQALINLEHYLVSSKVSLDIEGFLDTEQHYRVGEAITQTITISVEGAPAMMIPPLLTPTLTGISIYRKPAQVFDKANRGELLGTRVETITYIFEQVGDYKIPEQIIYWWNTDNNELEEIIVPEFSWSVGISNKEVNSSRQSFTLSEEQLTRSLVVATLLVVGSIVLFIFYRYKSDIFTAYSTLTQRERRILRTNFFQAIAKKEYLKANQYLYQYSILIQGIPETQHSPSTLRATLNQLAFSHNDVNDCQEKYTDIYADKHVYSYAQTNEITFDQEDGKALLKEITREQVNKKTNVNINKAIELNK